MTTFNGFGSSSKVLRRARHVGRGDEKQTDRQTDRQTGSLVVQGDEEGPAGVGASSLAYGLLTERV
jgi:hypothetical protein